MIVTVDCVRWIAWYALATVYAIAMTADNALSLMVTVMMTVVVMTNNVFLSNGGSLDEQVIIYWSESRMWNGADCLHEEKCKFWRAHIPGKDTMRSARNAPLLWGVALLGRTLQPARGNNSC